MIPRVTLKDFERDVINRQRNIVFPDTVLNEARFYRNIASGQAIYRPMLKLSVIALLLYLFVFDAAALAGTIAHVLREDFPENLLPDLLSFMWLSGSLLFWAVVASKGLFASPKPHKSRGGYRRSSIE
jgi:hypothetical protein